MCCGYKRLWARRKRRHSSGLLSGLWCRGPLLARLWRRHARGFVDGCLVSRQIPLVTQENSNHQDCRKDCVPLHAALQGRSVFGLGNRIEPAGVIGVAPRETPSRQPQAVAKTVALDRLNGVARTGRTKSAGRSERRRNPPLISANDSSCGAGDSIRVPRPRRFLAWTGHPFPAPRAHTEPFGQSASVGALHRPAPKEAHRIRYRLNGTS